MYAIRSYYVAILLAFGVLASFGGGFAFEALRAARTFQLRLPARTLVRNAWIANAFNNLIGLSGLAGSGIRMLLLGNAGIEPSRAAAFSALISYNFV